MRLKQRLWSFIRHTCSGREAFAKHRQTALRFGHCRLVLQDVPMFGQADILDPDDIRGDPRYRTAGSRKASMDDDVVALGDNELMLVT